MPDRQLARARRLLCSLQDHIRDTILASRTKEAATFSRIAAVTAADTIYHVDKLSEHAIIDWFEREWPRTWPVEVVMEGIEDRENLTFPIGTPVNRTQWKCILDPIDGTRGLMYDKRSAWILAGLAPQRGKKTSLRDILVAAMTELPTSKQWRADQFSAIRGEGPAGVHAASLDVFTQETSRLRVRPSQAKDFAHGFASVAKFFPDGKALLAGFEEKLWAALHPPASPSKSGTSASPGSIVSESPLIFDDQYISTGGQLYELLVGHDRLIADLRPLAFARLGLHSSLVCHPYDICTALILTESGGIVENPAGSALTAPLDTTSAVTWVGYANPALAKLARPVIQRLLPTFA